MDSRSLKILALIVKAFGWEGWNGNPREVTSFSAAFCHAGFLEISAIDRLRIPAGRG